MGLRAVKLIALLVIEIKNSYSRAGEAGFYVDPISGSQRCDYFTYGAYFLSCSIMWFKNQSLRNDKTLSMDLPL